MEKKDTKKERFQKKYIDNGSDNGSLVAPQVSGAMLLTILDVEKQGDIYPEILDKQVTDVWWWFGDLAFELSSSAKKIIVVDPIFAAENLNDFLGQEKERAGNRLQKTQQITAKDVANILSSQKQVYEGIQNREKYTSAPSEKILRNPSFAQDIQWIPQNSQDLVFLNFILDKLYTGDNATSIEEIRKALQSAIHITKSGWKIMGVHDISSHPDEIILALDNLLMSWCTVEYHQKGNYLVFHIDKI